MDRASIMRYALSVLAILVFGIIGQVKAETMTFHDFEFTAIEGTPLPAKNFAGKAVLVVNTASFCGFTKHYNGLQA